MAAMSSRNRVRPTFLITAGAMFMFALDRLIVATALPVIREDLGASLEALEWTLTAYTLTFAVLLLTGAALGDRFGRRRLFAIGVGLFTLGSGLAALAPSVTALLAARAVQGAGGAILTPLSLTILVAAVPPGQRGRALGIWGGVAGLATAIGPFAGGLLCEHLSWHWIFWVNVPIGIVLVPLSLRHLQESHGPHPRLDGRGLALAGAGVLGLVWGLVRGGASGWGSPEVVASMVAGALGLAAFVAWELRAPAPMLPMRLFRLRAFAAANTASLLAYFGLLGGVFLITQYLQTGLGYSPVEAGLRTLPWTVTTMLVVPLAGTLSDRLGQRPLMVGGLAVEALGFAWLASVAAPDADYGALVPALVLLGAGSAAFFAPVASASLSAVHPAEHGKASGASLTIREVSGVLGVAVLAAVFAANGGYGSPAAFADGLTPALWLACGTVTAAAIAAAAVPGRPGRRGLAPARLAPEPA
jgi:EmrB/QacA subfamily drug resistance transporter